MVMLLTKAQIKSGSGTRAQIIGWLVNRYMFRLYLVMTLNSTVKHIVHSMCFTYAKRRYIAW